MLEKIQLFTDGGARGNPGPAGIGYVIWDGNKLVDKGGEYIGKATNNQAEYKAIILGLEKAKNTGAKEVECFLDSELVVKQLNREYKVKDKDLAPLFIKAWNLSLNFKKISYTHIRREKNKDADSMVNEALDRELK